MLLALLIGVALTLTGCDSDLSGPELNPGPTEADALTPITSDDGPPARSGPIIFRFEQRLGFFIEDPETRTGAFFGVDLPAFCPGPASFELMSLLGILFPEEDRIATLVRDNVRASVWNPSPPFPLGSPAFCAAVTARDGFIGEGTADLIATDNDVGLSGGNANAFGRSAHGTLETLEGEMLGVSAHMRCIIKLEHNTFRCNEKVVVR